MNSALRPRLLWLCSLLFCSTIAGSIARADSPPLPEEFEILQPDPGEGENWTPRLAASGQTLLLGTPAHGHAGQPSTAGAAYVFVQSGSSWVLEQELFSDAPISGGTYGRSVELEGDRLVIGSQRDAISNKGAVYVYVRSGGQWTLEQKIQPAEITHSDQFGSAVALDGDTLVVGAPYILGAVGEPGKVYVYRHTGGAGEPWQQEAVVTSPEPDGKSFGKFLALDNDTLIIGSQNSAPLPRVFAYHRSVSGSGPDWTFEQALTSPQLQYPFLFGSAVAVSGTIAAVGAPQEGPGAVFLFERSAGGVWTEGDTLVPAEAQPGDWVASRLKMDASRIVAGGAFSERANIWERDDAGGSSAWVEAPDLLPSDFVTGDGFPAELALNGDLVFIASPSHDHGVGQAGATYVFNLLPDRDGDGIADGDDVCPDDPENDADQDGLCADAVLYLSPGKTFSGSGTLFQAEDIVRFAEATESYEIYMDGSQLGLESENVDAVCPLSDGSLLLSFSNNVTLPGIAGTVRDEDIVRFIPNQVGPGGTAGSFELILDGSAEGFSGSRTDIVGIGSQNLDLVAGTGSLYFSPDQVMSVGGISIQPEDVAVLDFGTGSYAIYFDGSEVGLGGENVDALHVGADGNLVLSFKTSASIPTLGIVPGEDAVLFIPTSLGAGATSGTFAHFYDAASNGLSGSGRDVDAIGVQP